MNHLAIVALLAAASSSPHTGSSTTAEFVGSTPSGEAISRLLDIPSDAGAQLIEWELSLIEGDRPQSGTYELRFKFGKTRPNQPGLDSDAAGRERRGTWRIAPDRHQQFAVAMATLDNGLSLIQVGQNVLHLLDADGRLMVGTGGWSYTLSRRDALERAVDPRLAAADSGDPSRTTSRSSGPTVFGIFDGRTPCQGIARELGVAARPGCAKAKWRLTLFQDPTSRQPTTYRLEGTLYGSRPREGTWRIARGIPARPDAQVYELAPANGESAALLLNGGDRVLFFLDHRRQPLTGNARNAYTLDRISGPKR